jgi:mannose-6-phosphate isomerase
LLVKFLDASQTLSVQVHPNDAQAAKLTPPDFGKTEAWIIMEAAPGSLVYAGLKPGVDRRQLETAIRQRRCQDCLHSFEPKPGDCLFLKAGTVHALGAGLLAAEVQQASDTTFRLFDWNRLGADGKPRPLQIEQGLDVIDYQAGPVDPCRPLAIHPAANRLVESDKFTLDRWNLETVSSISGDNRFHLLIVLDGQLQVEGDPAPIPLKRGDSLLLPACLGPIRLVPQNKAVFLDAYLPD